MLGIWGLPYPIVEAVANHHAPFRVTQSVIDILAAVYLANVLTNNNRRLVPRGAEYDKEVVELAYLENLGVSDRIDHWREMAKEQTLSDYSYPDG